MKKYFLILMFLGPLSLQAQQNTPTNCPQNRIMQSCEEWIFTGQSQKNDEDCECLVEETICRNYNGCGLLVSTVTQKRLSDTCLQ